MQFIDLTGAYTKHFLKNGDVKAYESSYPALFKHYNTYWTNKKSTYTLLKKDLLQFRLRLLKKRLRIIERAFKRFGINIFPIVVCFVGKGTSNGHVFLDKDGWVVWLPLEAYTSVEQMDVFVTHEILHAIQYSRRSEYYFKSKQSKEKFERMLLTEGVATYLTSRILKKSEKVALWADRLSTKQLQHWMKNCKIREKMLMKTAVQGLQGKRAGSGMFYANDSSDVRTYRAGYWIGLEVIKKIVKVYSTKETELLGIPRGQLRRMALTSLK